MTTAAIASTSFPKWMLGGGAEADATRIPRPRQNCDAAMLILFAVDWSVTGDHLEVQDC